MAWPAPIVAAAAARGLEPVAIRDVRTVAGRGIRGSLDGQGVAAGSAALMRELGWPLAPDLAERGRARETSGYSVMYAGWGERAHAVLSLDDTPLPEARATVEALRDRGVRVMLLTGDLPAAAQRIAAAVAIKIGDIEAGLAPEDKCAALERRRHDYRVVAMVGDGLNDAPGAGRSRRRDRRRLGHRPRPRDRGSRAAPGGLWMLPWVIDVARAVRADYPYQPDVGVRL